MKIVYKTNISEARLIGSGKVREIYDLGKNLLLVASDRLSAFDVVFGEPIPCKGAVLTQISKFWFSNTSHIISNHYISSDIDEYPDEIKKYKDDLLHRSMLVKKAAPLKAECIVRGYLDGSAYKEYIKSGSLCGITLPKGLEKRNILPEPIFTPTTKAEQGHDENISFAELENILGAETAKKVKEASLALYKFGHDFLLNKGIILSDTKYEFGIIETGEVILIDECMSPDSSRFWVAETYKPGLESVSFDKQFVRDYLESINWDKNPPAPKLPQNVIEKTTEKYVQAYKLITGRPWDF